MLQQSFSHSYYQRTITFLQKNPSLSDYLLDACDQNFDKVTTIIEPLLLAPKRCEQACHYIQAVVSDRISFLATNLFHKHSIQVTGNASNWLIGRNTSCAIFVPNSSVSRRHAVIGYCAGSGLYITDVGSRNGTKLNHKRLTPSQRYTIKDSDLIQIGSLKLEFFVSGSPEDSVKYTDVTCY